MVCAARTTGYEEFFPFFSWNLFSIVHDPEEEYGFYIIDPANQQIIDDKTIYYNSKPSFFKITRRAAAYCKYGTELQCRNERYPIEKALEPGTHYQLVYRVSHVLERWHKGRDAWHKPSSFSTFEIIGTYEVKQK